MEAKDTVIDIGEDRYDGLGADTLVEIQSEVSFKAGIREVVEDLDNHLMLLYLIKAGEGNTEAMSVINHIKDREQAKLKEWGIE